MGKSTKDHVVAPACENPYMAVSRNLGTAPAKGGDVVQYPGDDNLKKLPPSTGGDVSMHSYHLQPSMSGAYHIESLKSLLSIHSIQSQPQISSTTCRVPPPPPAHEENNHGEEWNPISLESVANDPFNPFTMNDLHLLVGLVGDHSSEMTGGNSDQNCLSGMT